MIKFVGVQSYLYIYPWLSTGTPLVRMTKITNKNNFLLRIPRNMVETPSELYPRDLLTSSKVKSEFPNPWWGETYLTRLTG